MKMKIHLNQTTILLLGKKAAELACKYVDWLLSTVIHQMRVCGLDLTVIHLKNVTKKYHTVILMTIFVIC